MPKKSIQSHLWNIVYTALIGNLKLGGGGPCFNPCTWDVETGDLCESEGNLVYKSESQDRFKDI